MVVVRERTSTQSDALRNSAEFTPRSQAIAACGHELSDLRVLPEPSGLCLTGLSTFPVETHRDEKDCGVTSRRCVHVRVVQAIVAERLYAAATVDDFPPHTADFL